MPALDNWLERAYWLSQISLVFIALIAGLIAIRQHQTFRLFELLRHIERPEVRRARRIVLAEISCQTRSRTGGQIVDYTKQQPKPLRLKTIWVQSFSCTASAG